MYGLLKLASDKVRQINKINFTLLLSGVQYRGHRFNDNQMSKWDFQISLFNDGE